MLIVFRGWCAFVAYLITHAYIARISSTGEFYGAGESVEVPATETGSSKVIVGYEKVSAAVLPPQICINGFERDIRVPTLN